MRPGPRAPVSSSDIEELHVFRVLLDEDAARLDLVAHEHRHQLIGRVRVFHVDADEEALRRVHRRLPQLVGVHLAEALVPGELNAAFLREVEGTLPKIAVRVGGRLLLAEREGKRRRPDDLGELRVRLPKVGVDRRREELGRKGDRLCRGGLLLDDADAEPGIVALEHGQRVAVRGQLRYRRLQRCGRHRVQLNEAVRHRQLRGVMAEIGPQARRPSLELRKRSGEALPARLGQLHLLAVAVGDVEIAEALAHEQVLELRLLLEIELLVADLHLVERRNGDVHVPAVEQLAHVAIEEGQHERADVRAVDIGVRHDDHTVVAQAAQVELVADAGSDGGDHRLDLAVGKDLVDAVLLAVDDLSAQRQDRLIGAVAALLRGPAGGVALDDEELCRLRIANGAVGELARQRHAVERRLATRQLARLARRLARTSCRDRLRDYLAGVRRVLLEELGELRVHGRLDEAGDLRVSELALRLTLELRVLQLDGDDGGEAFAHVLALEVLLLVLQQTLVARVLVQRARQGGAEPLHVGAALDRVDVVGEREDRVLVRAVPLHRHLGIADVALVLEVRDVLVDRLLRFIDVGDEVLDAALVVKLERLPVGTLVDQDDAERLRQERGLAEALCYRARVDVHLLEDLGVGEEADGGAGNGRIADDLHVALRDPARELLAVDLAVAAHLGDEPLRQRVDDGDADPVQAAGDLVALSAELAAGMELREDDRERRKLLILHDVDRDAGAPVLDRHRMVGMERDLDAVVAPRKGLVDGVVDDLVDEMVEAPEPRRADVHARAEPDRLESFQDGDVLCGIACSSHEKSPANPTFAGT